MTDTAVLAVGKGNTMDFLKNLLRGAIMGISEIIPGVSGGTMAVLMNIYDKLIGAISHLRKDFKNSASLLIPLVLGMAASILAFSHVITPLLQNYPMQVNFLFIGLVCGIIPMLFRHAKADGIKPAQTLPFFIMFALMVLMACFYFVTDTSLIISMDAGTFIRFMLIGFLAAVCLILPGVSGSMIMVIFGIYASVIAAISRLDIPMLIPVGIGVIFGLIYGSKIIDYCLHHFPQGTYFAIIGLVSGSIISLVQRALLPESAGKVFRMPSTNALIVSILLMAGGMCISMLFTSDVLLHSKKGKGSGAHSA